MKIAVTGKGGSGKTTISACLAKIFAAGGLRVLAVDADPSLNLAAIFGHEDITPLSGMKSILEERARLENGLVRMNPLVNDLIDRYSIEIHGNLRLLASGTVIKAGSGCLCPENAVLRSLLSELVLKRDEIVIIDMEAGLEPMSRGTIRNIDAILAITEPIYSSVSVTKRLLKFADELNIRNSYIIGNKIQSVNESNYLSRNLNSNIFHEIPYLEEIRQTPMADDLEVSSKFYNSIEELSGKLMRNLPGNSNKN